MSELKQLMDHHTFILRSDRKSLFTQIKNLVQRAKEVSDNELEQRRQTLKILLDHEDKIYEEEFANKVKARIDEDIQERKDTLLKIKEESTKNELEFLKSKRIQQYMNSCYEIREALRRQEMQNVKQCQLEQILEKERALRKEQDLEEYWQKVQQINIDAADACQREENKLKQNCVTQVANTLKMQLKELSDKREKERQEKLEEKLKLDAVLEEIRLENFDRKLQRIPVKAIEYRNELSKVIAEKKVAKQREEKEQAEMHRQMIVELQRIEAEETAAAREKKKAFHKATLDFINFTKRMRELEEKQQQAFYDRIDDLRQIDLCTKNNILREKQRKALVAEKFYAELKQQIGEQYEQRLREECEYRECKILENRFIHNQISREEILEKKRKNREDMEKQIEEVRKFRESEVNQFKANLNRASNDPEFCADLAKQYLKEGIDFLEPHPNWSILACPWKESVKNSSELNLEESQSKGATPKKSFDPCSCIAGVKSSCSKSSFQDGRGDEPK